MVIVRRLSSWKRFFLDFCSPLSRNTANSERTSGGFHHSIMASWNANDTIGLAFHIWKGLCITFKDGNIAVLGTLKMLFHYLTWRTPGRDIWSLPSLVLQVFSWEILDESYRLNQQGLILSNTSRTGKEIRFLSNAANVVADVRGIVRLASGSMPFQTLTV